MKYYSSNSTKEPANKNRKPTYNSSYTYGPPHSESNIPVVKFSVRENETQKVKMFLNIHFLNGDSNC